MPEKKLCREPAAGGPYLLRVKPTDELFFPHVDSCMAITYLMNSGAMIGGHVPMQWGADAPLYPLGNARKIIQEMSQLQAAGETIAGLISLCDLGASLDGVNPAWPLNAIYLDVPIQGVPHLIMNASGAAHGVDLSVNGQTKMVRAVRCGDTGGGTIRWFNALGGKVSV